MPRFIKLDGWDQQYPIPNNVSLEGSTYYVNIECIESVHEMFHKEDKERGHKHGDFDRTIVHVLGDPVSHERVLVSNWYTTTQERASEFMVRVNAILNAEKAVCDVPKEEKKV